MHTRCLGLLDNGCEAIPDSHLYLAPHDHPHIALRTLKQIETLSPDGLERRASKTVMKPIANSMSAAEITLSPDVEAYGRGC